MNARVRIAAALCAVGLAASCTAFGDPFTLDDPKAQVSLLGDLHAEASPGGENSCTAGTTFYWGTVRNTGDVDVENVEAWVDVYAGSGAFLGSFGEKVFSGDVTTKGDAETISSNLAVNASGSFLICTSVPWGAAARADFRAEFPPPPETEEP